MSESSMITGMLLATVAITPLEFLIDQLEKGLSEYKQAMLLATSEEEEKKILNGALHLPCLMLLIKACEVNPMEMIKDMSELERLRNLITPNKS